MMTVAVGAIGTMSTVAVGAAGMMTIAAVGAVGTIEDRRSWRGRDDRGPSRLARPGRRRSS
jgi:hypothetical protein